MNLLNVISNEESIGGLAISDDSIKFSRLKDSKSGLKAELLVEEKISDKELAGGDAAFIAKLLKFSKKNKIKYIIISVPTDNIFVKTYTFPAAMPDDKVKESINLTIDLQLPKKKEEIYCDWMKLVDGEEKKVLLSYVSRDYINSLISKIKKVGLKIVAIESHALSLARVIKQVKDESLLIVDKEINTTSFSVIKNNQLFFSWSAPNNKLENNLSQEINKIVNYHDWFNMPLKSLVLLGNFTEKETKKMPLKIINAELVDALKTITADTKWFASLGAAHRGLIARRDDKMISFMEIGTEKAYHQEKINTTVNFFIGISTALAIFFAAVFSATWFMLAMMQNNYSQQISSFNLSPSAENASTLREQASTFNSLTSQISSLIKKEPSWSKVTNEIKSKTTSGVIINNLSLPSANGQFSVTGLAINREAINNLKKSFESSEMFSEVNIPLNNLGKKVDIPFSMTFKMKDGQLIYSN
ncbi:MAG: pilus assembly protein PilM [Patescibacteria group bacterium]